MIQINSKEERDFFERVVMLVNNIQKYNFVGMSDTDFLKYLKRKFSKKLILKIYSSMIIGESPEEVAHKLKDHNGFDIVKEYMKLLKNKGFIVRSERKMGKRYCDLMAYNKNRDKLITFEIKANGDNLQKARDQLKDYFKWSNEVYLIVDERKKYNHIVNSKLKNDFGVIIYNQANNRFKTVKKSEYKNREFKHIKPFLNKRELKNINSNNWKVVLCKGF